MKKTPFTQRRIFGFKLWKVLLVVLLATGTVAALEYFRFQGLTNTLIALVDEETNGEYQLVIGKSEIDLFNLSMKLVNASISKTTPVNTGIDIIEIPEIYIDFGSLISLFNRKQVVIEDFHITEPVASLYLPDSDDKEPDKPLNIAHEVGQFFPFVESLLSEFDIISFRINRSGVNLERSDNTIRIGLITLLIDRWNMRDLSDEASIRLELWKQEIPIDRSKIAFDSVIYDYQDRMLSLKNFQMWQYDTLGRQTVHLRDADLIIHQLDWNALLKDEKYVLEEIRIESAKMTASIFGEKPVVTPEPRSRHPLSDLLKQNLGELQVKKGGIFDAHVDLMVYQPDDSVELSLPRMTIEFESLRVQADTSTIMFDKVEMSLREAELILDNDLSVKFKQLRYQEGVNLNIEDIELKHTNAEYDVIECENLTLYNFSIFTYLYEKRLKADSVVLNKGNIAFLEPPSEIRPRPSNPRVNRRKKPISMNIGKLIIREMDVLYNYDQQRFHAAGINGEMDDYIRNGSESEYKLRYLTSSKLRFTDARQSIDASAYGFNFRPRELRLNSLQGNYKEVSFSLSSLVAAPENFNLKKPFYYAWNTLSLGSLSLKGQLPPPREKKGSASNMRIEMLALDKLDIDLSREEQNYRVAGDKLRFSRVSYAEGNLGFPLASASLTAVALKNKDIELSIDNATIDNRRTSDIDRIRIVKNDLKAEIARLEIGPWEYKDQHIHMEHGSLKDLTLYQSDRRSHVDSIGLDQFTWSANGEPSLNRITVYSPRLNLTTSKSPGTKDSAAAPRPLKWVNEVRITPGELRINDQSVSFGKIDLVRSPEHVQAEINSLSYNTPASTMHLEQLKTSGDDIMLTGFTLQPTPGYEESMEWENDVFEGELEEVVLKEVNWTRLIEDHKLVTASLLLDGFDIEIRRDKQLPDPEPVIKPFLFSQLIPQTEEVQIPVIDIRGGNITYKERGEKTGRQGAVRVNDINGTLRLEKGINETENVLLASAKFYDSALFTVNYTRIDSSKFSLQVDLENLAAPLLNQMVDSLEAIKLKSGHISRFSMSIEGTDTLATGRTMISYDDLHIEIFKKGSPEQTSLGSGLLTLLADGIILNHSKFDALGVVKQERIREKGPINYWVKSLIHGALSAVRTGKSQKPPKEKKARKSR